MIRRVLFGAIDIGTNAGRILIGYVITKEGYSRVRQVQIVRVPLRLGDDVYQTGSISKQKERQFTQTFKSFSWLMKAYGVRAYRAYATSAMREASNGREVIERLFKRTGIRLELIDGDREAELIFSTFFTQKMPDHPYVFIDVGGGSTELSYILNGEKVGSKSFNIGTVRSLRNRNEEGVWDKITDWLHSTGITQNGFSAIGTGGNINRVAKLHQKRYLEPLTREEVQRSYEELSALSYEDRIEELRLKPDRADVIIPALEIYSRIMSIGGIDQIFVPKMGLADGMVLEQYFEFVKSDFFF
jgi:exopolyphosphatase/guanosine-5'-triphosphate,3'-diphosphate pyrophosphatase